MAVPFETIVSKRTSAGQRFFLMVVPPQFFKQLVAMEYVYYEMRRCGTGAEWGTD
jgi:hypothetical protein